MREFAQTASAEMFQGGASSSRAKGRRLRAPHPRESVLHSHFGGEHLPRHEDLTPVRNK